MFIFEKCTYDELQDIRHREDLLLSGWQLLEKEYIDETEKIYDEDGRRVALINYYFLNESSAVMEQVDRALLISLGIKGADLSTVEVEEC